MNTVRLNSINGIAAWAETANQLYFNYISFAPDGVVLALG